MGGSTLAVFNGKDYQGWTEDLEYYLMGQGLKDAGDSERMLGIFISHGGKLVKETYNLLKSSPKRRVGEGDNAVEVSVYIHARDVVDGKLLMEKNLTYETFLFRGLKQRVGEPFEQFMHRCEVSVDKCGFAAEDRDRHIRDQLVLGTINESTRQLALSENLDLKALSSRGRSIESSANFSDSIRIKEEPMFENVNAVSQRSGQFRSYKGTGEKAGAAGGSGRKCYNCGESFPHRGGYQSCPAIDHECRICRKVGHYKEFCNSSKPAYQSGNRQSQRGPRRGQYRGGQHQGSRGSGSRYHANVVEVDDFQEYESEQEQVLSLRAELESDLYVFSAHCGPSDKDKVDVLVDRVPVKFLPDTGASVTIIDRSTYDVMCQSGTYPVFRTDAKIYAYGSDDPLKLKGYINAKVSFNNKSLIVAIFVLSARKCGNLLSKKACQELGVIEMCESQAPTNISGTKYPTYPLVNHVNISENQRKEEVNISLSGKTNIPGSTETNITEVIRKVLDKFPEGIGRMKDVELRLDIDESVTPVAQTTRRIPFSQRGAVEEKIGELLREGIIERVEGPTPWLSPIHVVRQADKVRMVVDMSVANSAIRRSKRMLPTPEEMHCELAGSKYFTKLDMNSAYHQITLAPESRYITAFTTHLGTFRYKTVFFGCNAASEGFDEKLSGVLAGLQGVFNIADDMLIHGKDRKEHDERLLAVLVRLLEYGITLNRGKCIFGVEEVSFFGQWVSGKGTRPMIKDNLKEIQRPQNKAEVRSYIGLVNFIGKFIPNFSTRIAPISSMLSKEAVFVWGEAQEEAFQSVLEEIRSPRILQHFDPKKETSVIVDASPVGLCGILAQEEKPVLFISRKLTPVESRYSQTEREALSVVWACERLHFYLYGIDFTVVTDHKALEILYSPKGKPAARILRWYIRLLPYSFTIKYAPGKDNPADYFSRKPVSGSEGGETLVTETEEYVNNILIDSVPNSITLQELTTESLRDVTIQKLVKCIREDRWSGVEGVARYGKVKLELLYKNGVVMRGHRIVLPEKLRNRAIMLAHASHLGMTRTKQYVRAKLWWPGLDEDIERVIQSCGICQAVNPEGGERLEPLRLAPFPARPFSTVNIDLFGPLASGETILGIVDQYSKWPELYVLKGGVSTEQITKALDELFARFGNAEKVISDNGPQFTSWKFSNFMEKKGIKHHLITPYYPQANSTVERFFRSLKKFVKTCSLGKVQLKSELNKFLRLFRNTPSRATGRTPASLILSYEPVMDYPSLRDPEGEVAVPQVLNEHNLKYRLQAKEYSDRVNHHRLSETKEGDTVLLKNLRPKKHEPVFYTDTHTITRRSGNQVEVERDRDKKKYIRPLNLIKVVKRVDYNAFRDNVLNFKPGPDLELEPSAVAVETECERPKPRKNPMHVRVCA